jgi:protein TonB
MNSYTLIAQEERTKTPTATIQPFVLPTLTIPLSPNLFSDCLVEASGQQRKQRSESILFSAVVQCLVLSFLILIPLIYTEVLPAGMLATYLMTAPPPPPPPPPAPAALRPTIITSNLVNGQLIAPTAIPTKIQIIHEEEIPPDNSGGVAGGVVGGVPGGQLGGAIGGVLGGLVGSGRPVAVPAPVLAKRVRVSQGVSEGLLLNKTKPEYPVIAKIGHVEGVVVIDAVISAEGIVDNLHVVSGNPILIQSAMDAVKQWRYKPFLLSGVPVAVETRITVNFQLNGQ